MVAGSGLPLLERSSTFQSSTKQVHKIDIGPFLQLKSIPQQTVRAPADPRYLGKIFFEANLMPSSINFWAHYFYLFCNFMVKFLIKKIHA